MDKRTYLELLHFRLVFDHLTDAIVVNSAVVNIQDTEIPEVHIGASQQLVAIYIR